MPLRPTLAALLLMTAGCVARPIPAAGIDAAAIRRHVEVLASDAYEGRAPGTAGEAKTVAYIVEQMKARGLEPGNKGSWFQDVPLVEVGPSRTARLEIRGRSAAAALEAGADVEFRNPGARA